MAPSTATAIEDLADAQRVCDHLGIELHAANFAAEYWDDVFAGFLKGYAAGQTPNPDILCNREIKFKQFVDYASLLGADYIATGHYARSQVTADGEYQVFKGVDDGKDQTYFLQAVPQDALARCLFPLGDWQKADVRARAEDLGLHNHERKDSTGICFIGERRFADFLARYLADAPGDIVAEDGRIIGQHRGLHRYTLGQRQGLGLGGIRGRSEAPWYVIDKDAGSRRLLVSQDEALLGSNWLRAVEPNWLADVDLPLACQTKIRYRQVDQACTIRPAADGALRVTFDVPQRAITPGQYAAFYDGDRLLGGALIAAAERQALAWAA